MAVRFPDADPELIEHAVPLVAAFDTATVYAMSFGIAKFQLAQHKVKLVGEYVGRDGRSPNPDIIRAIKRWPPVNTLKDVQAFFGHGELRESARWSSLRARHGAIEVAAEA